MASDFGDDFAPAGEIEMQMVDTLTRVETIMANVQFLINRQGGDSKALLQRDQERKKDGPVNTDLRDLPKKLMEERTKMAAKEQKLTEELRQLREAHAAEVRVLRQELEAGRAGHEQVTQALHAELESLKAAAATTATGATELRAELAEQQQQLAEQQQQMAEQEQKLAAAQAATDDVQRAADDLRRQLQAVAAERDSLKVQLADLMAATAETEQALQAEVEALRREVDGLQSQQNEMAESYARNLDESRVETERQEALFNGTLQELSQAEHRLSELEAEHQVTMARYKQEMAERRRLFNLVQELRGSIRVFCRVRPLLKDCDPPDAVFNPQFDEREDGVIRLCEQKRGAEKVYQ
eukprot:EG_transcript_16719